MRLKAPKRKGIRAESSRPLRNPNPRKRGKKEGAVGETLRARRAPHSESQSATNSEHQDEEEGVRDLGFSRAQEGLEMPLGDGNLTIFFLAENILGN